MKQKQHSSKERKSFSCCLALLMNIRRHWIDELYYYCSSSSLGLNDDDDESLFYSIFCHCVHTAQLLLLLNSYS